MKFKIQNIVFPKENICDVEELYYRKIGLPTIGEIARESITFRKNQRIHFDTYYNSLSLLKWIKYTYANSNFSLNIKLKGRFIVRLVHMWLENNGHLRYEIVNHCETNNKDVKEYELPYTTSNPFGMLTFQLEAIEDDSVFYGASYVSDVEHTNNVKIGMGICTFKRESYVINNIRNIKKYIWDDKNSPLKDKLDVFISDNAQTLKKEDFEDKHAHLVYNKNTGGSGGFTRCMIEAINYNKTEKQQLTHLLLTDDDIKFDPVSIERTYAMLSLLRPEYEDAFVGGAMFKMDKQNIQHASGEVWHKERCQNFIETFNNRRNVIELKDILENENFTVSNHQGWWFCAMPMKFIREDNLSMPFFIKSDDIDFSIRNMKHHILLNGINVWHESFESKYSAQNEYYTVRNYLISAAVHHSPITKQDILTMFDVYTKHYIANYKYIEIEHFCNAINDFLGGIDHFKTIDLEKYHKSILSMGYKMVDVDTLPVKFSEDKYFRDISYDEHVGWLRRKFRKLTINGLLLPSKGFAVLGMWGGSNVQTYRKKFLVRYEIETKKGFILTRSLKKALKMYFMYRKTRKKLVKKFDKAFAEFQARWKELVTLDNWNNYLK